MQNTSPTLHMHHFISFKQQDQKLAIAIIDPATRGPSSRYLLHKRVPEFLNTYEDTVLPKLLFTPRIGLGIKWNDVCETLKCFLMLIFFNI